MTKHDVIVIGGSLAGSTCVRELESRGIDAIALERDQFPRRKVCGGFLSPGAVDCVSRLGLLERVLDAGAVAVRVARVRAGRHEVEIPFERCGLGISRSALDGIFAAHERVHQRHAVREVRRTGSGFNVDGVSCSVVIDASGKLGRFTRRHTTPEFGIQYTERLPTSAVLDFWFCEDRYGGGVSVEGGVSNFCFLVKKDALAKHLAGQADCLVTGPLAYDTIPGEFIAIGDAGGMLDPFCGDGMRHAMETGMLAARVVAAGIRRRRSYEEIKWEYEAEWQRQWALKRQLGSGMRKLQKQFGNLLKLAPSWLVNRIWD
jgi:flavin-dependent dehydrogenase